jgi:hypothetical protein
MYQGSNKSRELVSLGVSELLVTFKIVMDARIKVSSLFLRFTYDSDLLSREMSHRRV